ncbi:uncharacterized protein EI90DRAFT_3027121 [Cantharellus anzutake]|uniref:uncharacterized protein n=1 Tax=Cantharellus anzutake TaxID=1750568 RepID=UPI0019074112|nr:uncharacterized protein EI90DRAFT_3027121 [Cantharellus anzutake]KAF8343791.1 hypothetical protein EI90DRAFT_3027121 [Cantharellus anzutake]
MSSARDHDASIYLAVYVSRSSDIKRDPSSLSCAHPSVTFVSQVGALEDVQLVSVPKPDWEGNRNEILGQLQTFPGVVRVEVQEAKQRAKRSNDEL